MVVAPWCAPTRGPRSIVGADLAAMDAWDCRGGRAQVRSYKGASIYCRSGPGRDGCLG